jgi:hypothetical protein
MVMAVRVCVRALSETPDSSKSPVRERAQEELRGREREIDGILHVAARVRAGTISCCYGWTPLIDTQVTFVWRVTKQRVMIDAAD